MSVALAAQPHDAVDTLEMESFFDDLVNTNPFLSNAVNDPSADDVDVPSIHQEQFDELIRCAQEAWRLRNHAGQVVWGEAGIGKSHLLARLCRWADSDDHACCVFLHNIQPSPEQLPQYVLKCVVQRLVRGRAQGFHATPLYWLVTRAVEHALNDSYQVGGVPSARDAWRAYAGLVDRLLSQNAAAGVDARVVYQVLFRFFLGAYRGRYHDGNDLGARLAVRWLCGDGLDREEAAELELRISQDPDNPARLPGPQAVESVLLALAELAAIRGQPMILCFDQVDNLSKEQLTALTQFLHPLLDHARNLLVVTSGVQSKLVDSVRDGVILRAAWERLAQDERGIRPGRIGVAQAREILAARVARFVQPHLALPQVQARFHEDPLFPLGSGWFAHRTGETIDCRPRDIINWARDRWRDQQRRLREASGAAWLARWSDDSLGRDVVSPPSKPTVEELARRIDEHISRKIGEQIARREIEPDTLPPDAGNLAGLLDALLSQAGRNGSAQPEFTVEQVASERPGRLPIYQLVFSREARTDGPSDRTGVTCVATENRTSSAGALRRIVDDATPPDRVLVVCDERLPLSVGGKGQEYLDALRQRGPDRFQLVELTFHEYAELDALQAVIGDARSGDLEADLPGGVVHRISEDEAIASHHRQDRYRSHRLLGMLLSIEA